MERGGAVDRRASRMEMVVPGQRVSRGQAMITRKDMRKVAEQSMEDHFLHIFPFGDVLGLDAANECWPAINRLRGYDSWPNDSLHVQLIILMMGEMAETGDLP
jgi:hypothetical protein